MSDFPRALPLASRVPSRGVRIGVVSVLVGVAFLIGLALAIMLVRRQDEHATPGIVASETPTAQPGTAGLTTLSPAALPAAPATADPVALAERQAALSGDLAALEARAAALSASAAAAGGQAARAEAMLTLVAARRALDKGMGLGGLDAQLQARLGQAQPRAVAIVRDAARQPVTLEELRQGLDAIGPLLATGVGQGWVDSIRQALRTLVILRRAGTPSPLPADHLDRARRLLDLGQVDAARAEVLQLPGARDAGNWLGAAHRYVLARQALDVLETAALTGQAQPAPAATLAPVATPR